MFLQLNHKSLDVYKASRELLLECYNRTKNLPLDERFNLTQQIRRAALSVKLNIAEGASRKSFAERKRFYEIARGSIIEIDAAFETTIDLLYFKIDDLETVGILLNRCFSMLTKMTAG